jgi:hypothetical protein
VVDDGGRDPFKASTEGGSPRKGLFEIKKKGGPFQNKGKA